MKRASLERRVGLMECTKIRWNDLMEKIKFNDLVIQAIKNALSEFLDDIYTGWLNNLIIHCGSRTASLFKFILRERITIFKLIVDSTLYLETIIM